jgi:4-amino-4-deoxy-L-arabinose transferase-like glycosyltransferase
MIAALLCVLAVVRLVGLRTSNVDLFSDESQYWSWSRDLAFGYFSKPPLLAWMIAAATRVCGDAEWCVRAPAPLMNLATSLIAYAIGHTLYDGRTGVWAAMLTALGTGAVFSARIMSTDVPMVMFWAVALYAYARLLQEASWRWAIVLGIAIGAGLLSKYAMIYFLPGMLIAAFLEKPARVLLGKPHLWLALGVAAVTVSPNVAWNVANSFLTMQHAVGNVADEPIEPSLLRPLTFLAAQFAVFGPVVFAAAIAALIALLPRSGFLQLRPADRIMLAFAVPPLAVVTATAIVVHAYANWAAASFVSLAVLAAALLVRRNASILLWASLALGLAAQILLIGGDAFAPRMRLPIVSRNPYERTLGWKSYAHAVGELARREGALTIASDTRADIASLLYYWRDQPEQIAAWPTEDLPAFETTQALTAAAPQPVLFVGCPVIGRLKKYYADVTWLGPFLPDDPVPRVFVAFKLERPRGPIGRLPNCRPE